MCLDFGTIEDTNASMSRESVAGAERLCGIGSLKYGGEGWTWGSWKSGSMTRIDTIAVRAVGGSKGGIIVACER